MSNNANLLADLDGFYRGSDSGPAQDQQAQAPQSHAPQQSSSDPFGLGSVAQSSQGPAGGNLADDDDDDWGGFETAEPAAPQGLSVPKPFNVAPVTSPVPAPSDPFEGFTAANATPTPPTNAQTDLPRPPPSGQEQAPPIRNRPARVPTMQLVTNSLLDLDASPQVSSDAAPRKPDVSSQKSPQKPPRKTARRDPNVLFDADDVDEEEEEDDEFGDFEDVDSWDPASGNPAPPTGPTTQPASVDLLSMDDPLPTPEPSTLGASKTPGSLLSGTNTMPAPTHVSAQPPSPLKQRSAFPDLAVSTSQAEKSKKTKASPGASPSTPWPDFEDGGPAEAPAKEEWPSFNNFQQAKPRKAAPAPAPAAKAVTEEEPDNWDWDAVEASDTTAPPPPPLSTRDDYDDKEPPPTNIPPPSVLMTILPELLSLVNTSLLKPTAGHTPDARKKLLTDPSTIAFLRAYLLIATVTARILAGRKLRWNRDRFLAQGMAISAAGAKGMKLAGVDKAEAGREDREAADVVAAWREQVGRVRAAVAGANGAIAEGGGLVLKVPEIGEGMKVSTAKAAPRAPRQCVVCGLKREERVARVDFEVEDSFGEWWVEHWGHRACRNFWKEHEGRLRQR